MSISSLSSSNKRSRERQETKSCSNGGVGVEGEPEAKKSIKFEHDAAATLFKLTEAPPTPLPQKFKLREITSCYCDKRRTNDEIHSSVHLGPVLTCILDTPPMQRLRGLKQLGTAEYVYVNVSHSRFEHSLGVAVLAETLCQKIRTSQPSLKCTAKDVLCVQLAGECQLRTSTSLRS